MHNTTECFKENQNNQGHPSVQSTTKLRWAPGLMWIWWPGSVWDEHRVHCWLLQVLWTATMEREARQIGIKLVHNQDWDHNPSSTLEVLKLVKLIHHKLRVYKVKRPAKWDYSANNAVLDGAVKGHNSQWDDCVSQLLRLITRFTFRYLVILGGFSVGMKPTDRNILLPKKYFSQKGLVLPLSLV